jgi:hypothetical protein
MREDDFPGVGSEELDLPKDDRKAEKKRRKKLEETLESGTLDPWERYRVLLDLLEMYNDISEMADRKTRFALVILGALNTVNVLIVARPEIFFRNGALTGPWVGIYLITYVGLSLFLFLQAIGALKPRVSTLLSSTENSGTAATHQMLGLRFISLIRETPFEEYYERWKSAKFSDVNRELALSVQMVAGVITEKYKALHRLYTGLMILVFLTAGLITTLVYLRILQPPV